MYDKIMSILLCASMLAIVPVFTPSKNLADTERLGDEFVVTDVSETFETEIESPFESGKQPKPMGPPYDYVIITTNAIVANSDRLEHFVYLKELYGHSVLVVTESDFDILTGPPPNGRAEKIKQWLVDNHGPLGIEYVLLIGNPDPDDPVDPADSVGDIPMKMTMQNYFSWKDRDIPTDMFYADLDGDWDLDGDGYYYEPVDVNNPESPDLVSISTDYFSAKWTGYVLCDFDVEYEFGTWTDGGIKIWIDGDLIIDNWDDFSEHPLAEDTAKKVMTAGWHDIEVKYKEHTGDAIVRLFYRTTVGGADPKYIGEQVIPVDHFRDEMDLAAGLRGRFYNNIDASGTPDLVKPDNEKVDYIWATGDLGSGGAENDGDVWVGRIPVYQDNYTNLDHILGKIIQYETDPGDISWRESILLPVWPLTDTTPAYQYPEEVLNDYAIAAGFDYYRLYKEDYAPVGGPTPEHWPTSPDAVADEWSKGYGVVTWWTHGGTGGASYIFSYDMNESLDDSKPAFTYQASCGNANPESYNNLAYTLLKHGAVATVGATRASTGSRGNWTYDSTSMANPNFGYAYNRGIIQDGWPAGKALVEAKKPTLGISRNELNYNLYGDPETYLLTVVPNSPPVAVVAGPVVVNEGELIIFDGSSSYDPEGDPLEYRWDVDHDGTWDTGWSSSPFAILLLGDDYEGEAKLEVRDKLGLSDWTVIDVTVLNMDPTIDYSKAYILVDFTLRVAGEKWHNVEMYILEDGIQIGYAEVVRYPGNPDDQSQMLLDVECDVSKVITVKLMYTPMNDPVNGQPNGASPAWVNVSFDDGGYNLTQHNFNVMHPDRWEWDLGINQFFAGHEIAFDAEASDEGSDDLTITWHWDDGTADESAIDYNDGMSPDPYPSPGGTFPFTASDSKGHIFTAADTYDVKLTVTDDDGGLTELLIVIILI